IRRRPERPMSMLASPSRSPRGKRSWGSLQEEYRRSANAAISGRDPIHAAMKPRPLLHQVLAVNLMLVAASVLVATIAVNQRLHSASGVRSLLVLVLAMLATFLGNALLLRRRFAPLER